MTRSAILAILLASVAVAPALADDSSTPLDPAIEKCIRDNAPKVETAIPDLTAATDFLVTKLCAEPVAALNDRESERQHDRTVAQWKDYCDKQKAAASERPGKQANAMASWCESPGGGAAFGVLIAPSEDDEYGGVLSYLNTTPPPSAVALAAHLLLDLRLSHLKPGSTR